MTDLRRPDDAAQVAQRCAAAGSARVEVVVSDAFRWSAPGDVILACLSGDYSLVPRGQRPSMRRAVAALRRDT